MTTTTIPVTNNTPPVITSLTTNARVEANTSIPVVAVVTDAETPISQLGFVWSAAPVPGMFTGTGPSVMWQAPTGQLTPNRYTLTLKVTETLTLAGQSKENVVSSNVTVHYNDSPAEMTFLATDYLVNRFANNNVSPADAVINFADSCPEKAAEFDDVVKERRDNNVLSGSFMVSAITGVDVNEDQLVEGTCIFEDIPKTGPDAGKRRRATGTCRMHTRYEDFRWFLCDSTFSGNVVLESVNGGLLVRRSVTNARLADR